MGIAILIAVGVGVGIAAQVSIVGQASRSIHPLVVSLALQASGLLVATVWAAWTQSWPPVVEVVRQWWWIPLGLLGWGLVAALGFAAARLGASPTLAVVIAAQLIAALALDRLGGRADLDIHNLAGAALLCIGVVLITVRSSPSG
jgi:uncharacterized membrane protein YdcZ (DUF606 family)